MKKIDDILASLIALAKKTTIKIYITLKNKDEYLTKYVNKGIFQIIHFPKGELSKKTKVDTKVPLEFFASEVFKNIVKIDLVNDKINTDKPVLCIYKKN